MTKYGSECRTRFDNESFSDLAPKPSRYASAEEVYDSYEQTAGELSIEYTASSTVKVLSSTIAARSYGCLLDNYDRTAGT